MKTIHQQIRIALADENLQIALDGNALRRTTGRKKAFAALPDYAKRRARAHAIKAEIIAHLDKYVSQFAAKVAENGIHVHRAKDADAALGIFLEIAGQRGAKLVAKAKSMVTEEIEFNHRLEAAGLRAVETDLGEYIVQMRGERPSHILTPAAHLRRQQVGQLFHEKLGVPYTEDIPEMVATARRVLREVFLTADIGVSGVNFGVVESGTLCLVTNEGNGRMVTTIPPVHVALMGIERLVPTLDDLALFLSLLPRAAIGQKRSVYTTLINAPRRTGDADGPAERHLIIVDNGRTAMQASPLAEALACLRCGACLNACPVFREIGGHAYLGADGSIAPYPGPIGSVVSAGLFGCENFGQLAQASSLCGACKEACPVDIDLPKLLLRVRAGEVGQKAQAGVGLPAPLKLGLKVFGAAATSPAVFGLGQKAGALAGKIVSPGKNYLPLPAWTGWGYSKDFPKMAEKPFRERWKQIRQNIGEKPLEKPAAVPKQDPESAPEVDSRSLGEIFTAEALSGGSQVYRVTAQNLIPAMAAWLKERNIDRVSGDSLGADLAASLGIPFSQAPDPSALAGITGAVTGIADSGSLVLLGGPSLPLSASLLPDFHLCILPESSLVRTLDEALALPALKSAPMLEIVTGPSRTGDIEMALTTGVHGPKQEHIFLLTGENP
jgi:L-lactate dehydrogenase complex protein LldF